VAHHLRLHLNLQFKNNEHTSIVCDRL
jgi:hypothetical protein